MENQQEIRKLNVLIQNFLLKENSFIDANQSE